MLRKFLINFFNLDINYKEKFHTNVSIIGTRFHIELMSELEKI